jgi:hypothetical protein
MGLPDKTINGDALVALSFADYYGRPAVLVRLTNYHRLFSVHRLKHK